MDINGILSGSISGFATGGILVWLLRTWISQRLKNSIEHEYKIKLTNIQEQLKRDNAVYMAQLNAELEKSQQTLKHNLELARLEHQIKYSGSYNEILESIKVIFPILVEIHESITSYTCIFETPTTPSKKEKRERTGGLIDNFWKEFNQRRIFFNETLDKEITVYVHIVVDKGLKFMNAVEEENPQTGCQKEWIDTWNKIDKEVREQWNTTLLSIRTQFREIIGVSKEMDETT